MAYGKRDYADVQDKRNAKVIRGNVQLNSGATGNRKGDSYNLGTDWSILVEGKTTAAKEYEQGVRQKSIKLEWLTKVAAEAFSMGKSLWALAFSFDNKKDYYIMDEVNFKNMYQALLDYEAENHRLTELIAKSTTTILLKNLVVTAVNNVSNPTTTITLQFDHNIKLVEDPDQYPNKIKLTIQHT